MRASSCFGLAAGAFVILALAGCASPPPPRCSSYSSPRPAPSGSVSVRYVQPAPAPAAASTASASRDAHVTHMRRALSYLRTAKAQLQSATKGKGGHRVDAIQFTDDAIGHVEAGIAHAQSH